MLDSDVGNGNENLNVEFYTHEKEPYKDKPFVKIFITGDTNNIIDQPVREDHKARFPREWMYFQMKSDTGLVIGTTLPDWNKDQPEEFNDYQMVELQILKFQTVEQVATASDSQLQRVGMGGTGLRERARAYLLSKNQTESSSELAKTRTELDELKAQMAELLSEKRKAGRPKKEV